VDDLPLETKTLRIQAFNAHEDTVNVIKAKSSAYGKGHASPIQSAFREVVPKERGRVERYWLLSDAEIIFDGSNVQDELVRESRKKWEVTDLEKIAERK
jgi:hypothetical protein